MKTKLYTLLFTLSIALFSFSFESDVNVYPNPSLGIVRIDMDTKDIPGEIVIYNYIGERVRVQPIVSTTSKYEFDIIDLPDGNYFIKVLYNDGTSATKMVSKSTR